MHSETKGTGDDEVHITAKMLFSELEEMLLPGEFRREEQRIHQVRFLLRNQQHFEQNTLYIGKTSVLEKGASSSAAAFIGVRDCPVAAALVPGYFSNYAFLKEGCDPSRLFNRAQDIISREQTFLYSSAMLLHSLIIGKGLQHIVDMGYQLLNNPILLVDSSYKLMAHTKGIAVDDLVWNELVSKGYCSYDLVSIFKREGVVKKIADSKKPLLTDSGFSDKIRRIHGKIIINDKLVAYLGVLEHNQKFTEDDFRIIQLLCDVISEEMKKNSNHYQIKGLMYENILIDLLDNTVRNPIHLQERLKTAGLKSEGDFYLMVFQFQNEDIANYHLVDHFRGYIDSLLVPSRTIFYHDQIVTVLSAENEQVEEKKAIIKTCLVDNHLRAGLSARFNNMIDLPAAYHQAQQALELGSNLAAAELICSYPEYRLYHLLSLAGREGLPEGLPHPAPSRLKDFDTANGTSLYPTLYTYLENNLNTKLSAKQLFIHRNTMSYRLKQIARIGEVNLEDYEETVLVYLTYKMQELERALDCSGIKEKSLSLPG